MVRVYKCFQNVVIMHPSIFKHTTLHLVADTLLIKISVLHEGTTCLPNCSRLTAVAAIKHSDVGNLRIERVYLAYTSKSQSVAEKVTGGA